jgi:2-(1,2-epoxy-1,2-dihydrophenyl)acetyl-CoA isomerase
MSDALLVRVENHVAVVTINRPESYNSLNTALLEEIPGVLQDIADNADIGCLVITGAGKAFCSGGDVKDQVDAAGGTPKSSEERMDDLRKALEGARLLHEMPKPTIAMINGVAAGAGMTMSLACDMRIAGKKARMTTAFAKVGFSGDYGGHYFLPRLVGTAKARELYFTSEILDSEQIEKLGLANRVVADEDLEKVTMELATQLGNGPRIAWRYMKQNMKVSENGTLSDVLDSECAGIRRCRETEDHKEAARAFVEKRPPVFSGK